MAINYTLIPNADGTQRTNYPNGDYAPVTATYYVDPVSGSDSGDWLTPATAAKNLTTVLGSGLLGPGITINLLSGEYRDSTYTVFQEVPMAWTIPFNSGGIEGNPLVIQAAPGHEGNVVLSGKNIDTGAMWDHGGFLVRADWITFKNLIFRDVWHWGIVNWHSIAQSTPPYWSQHSHRPGIVVDSCVFYNVSENPGYRRIGNQCPVRMDGSDGMIIRNCFAADSYSNVGELDGSLYLNFNGRNTLIENCTVHRMRQGLGYQKQYSVGDDNSPLDAWEFQYNYVNDCAYGLSFVNQDNQYQCPGNHYAHHNIVVNANGLSAGNEWFGFRGRALLDSIAPRVESAGITTLEHNTFILQTGTNAIMILGDGVGLTGSGNILGVGTKVLQSGYKDRISPNEGVHEFDYNLYSGQLWYFRAQDTTEKTYTSLAQWQAAQESDHINLAVSNPDQNSIIWGTDPTYAVLFNDYSTRDFTYAPGSPAIGFMPGGNNAGHYETGSEIIGCRLPWIDLSQFWADIPDWLNPGGQP